MVNVLAKRSNPQPENFKGGGSIPLNIIRIARQVIKHEAYMPNTTTNKNHHSTPLPLIILWNADIPLGLTELAPSGAKLSRTVIKKLLYLRSKDVSSHLYPQKRIPDVRTFRVKVLSDYHPVFKERGIPRREFPPIFETSPHNNKYMNKYLRHQFRRLIENVHNPSYF